MESEVQVEETQVEVNPINLKPGVNKLVPTNDAFGIFRVLIAHSDIVTLEKLQGMINSYVQASKVA